MLAYGYEWNSGEVNPQVLREASMVCTGEELDSLIEMLQTFRDSRPREAEGDHQHFRDWYPAWTETHSDLIIWLSDHTWTKENQE